RYRRGAPGVDDSSTVSVFRLFHAPLGFVILGFGALTDLLAAPFDNYWHELYGIDVTLWSPFHIMGTIGGMLAGLGSIYIFASEAAHERQTKHVVHSFLGCTGSEWGAFVLFAALIELTLPALTAFLAVTIGSFQLLTYPLTLVFVGGCCLISVVRLTHKPGAATLTALLLCLEAVATQAFVPWALRATVASFGLSFRFSGRDPTFNIPLTLMPLLFLIFALLVDAIAFFQLRQSTLSASPASSASILPHAWLLSGFIAPLAVVVPPSIIQALLHLIPTLFLPPDIVRLLTFQWSALALTLPLTLLVGAVAIACGVFLGDIWHWNKQ
ncbi:MAG: hypothetical protein M3Z24_10180, partial [Chloroflexota bacterium]|nr:hypothetical protein [Chloroflexota bacterium]